MKLSIPPEFRLHPYTAEGSFCGRFSCHFRVRPVLEAVAAKVDNGPSGLPIPLGPRSAGHYVKMVHNGIEYGLMQLIAETYHLMKRGLGLNDDELSDVYRAWNTGELNGIPVGDHKPTSFLKTDEQTGKRLIDLILDEARQKGTGMWASQDAMDLQVPVPTIDVAVAMRNLSAFEKERKEASRVLPRPIRSFAGDRQMFIGQLRSALYAGMIITYVQGMALLVVASAKHGTI